MMAEGRSYFQIKPYLVLFPGRLPFADGAGGEPGRQQLARDALDPRLARRL